MRAEQICLEWAFAACVQMLILICTSAAGNRETLRTALNARIKTPTPPAHLSFRKRRGLVVPARQTYLALVFSQERQSECMANGSQVYPYR